MNGRWLRRVLLLGGAPVAVAAAAELAMPKAPIVDVEAAPARGVALVLGCGPGPLLEGRMDAACALVEAGKVDRLVLSGLPREAPRMRVRALACLPPDRIDVDDGAYRTLENLRRARDRFDLRAALVVSQPFHLQRALFLAGRLGMDAVGVRAPGEPSFFTARVREPAARVRAWLDAARLAAGGS